MAWSMVQTFLMHSCNNVCIRYKANKPKDHKSRYGDGQKYCSGHCIFIKWDGLWCPCCGYFLKRGSKNRYLRKKLTLKE